MSTFRNIIARRRPSVPAPEPIKDFADLVPAPQPKEGMHQPRHNPINTPRYSEDVPNWELEPPRRTIGETRADQAYPAAAHTSAKTEEAASLAPRRGIWDLDAKSYTAASWPASDNDPVAAKDDESSSAGPNDRTATPVSRLFLPFEGESPDAEGPKIATPTPAALADSTPLSDAPLSTSSGRVKTRLLGFHSEELIPDAFAAKVAPVSTDSMKCPVGWVVIVDGPGRGTSFSLASGLSKIGRGAEQTIALDFGDNSISRENHASIAYDEEENKVLIGHGGKTNLVRLNGKPLLNTEELKTADHIRIGKTTLRFIAFCGPDFSWSKAEVETGGADYG